MTAADNPGVRAFRPTPMTSGGDRLLAALQSCPASERVTVRLSTSTPRTRRSIAELLQAHAFAAHCQIAVAETRGIAVRWVDGIVSGTATELAAFLATVTPVLDRSHGTASLATAA
jgi:hypothetical protein